MNIQQKVFAIVKQSNGEIVSFGLQAKEVHAEWEECFVGTEDENTHMLQQTFMSQDEIRKQMSV